MRRGHLNVHKGLGGSLTAITQDLTDIWGEIIQEQLDIPLKDLKVSVGHRLADLGMPQNNKNVLCNCQDRRQHCVVFQQFHLDIFQNRTFPKQNWKFPADGSRFHFHCKSSSTLYLLCWPVTLMLISVLALQSCTAHPRHVRQSPCARNGVGAAGSTWIWCCLCCAGYYRSKSKSCETKFWLSAAFELWWFCVASWRRKFFVLSNWRYSLWNVTAVFLSGCEH